MICHHCGRDNPDDEMFCLACGEALRAEPDEPEVVLPEPPQQPVRQEPVEEDYGETEPYFATKAARRRMHFCYSFRRTSSDGASCARTMWKPPHKVQLSLPDLPAASGNRRSFLPCWADTGHLSRRWTIRPVYV